jgi:Fe-S-cluster containining protein
MALNYYRELARRVEEVYQNVDEQNRNAAAKTKLKCLDQCGKCCFQSQIETTPLEMLPLALAIFDQKKTDLILHHSQLELDQCIFFEKKSADGSLGFCGKYKGRPLVCRGFGFSAVFNKLGDKTLSLCKLIKEKQPLEATIVKENFLNELVIVSNEAAKINGIAPGLSEKMLVNQALKKILEKLIFIAQYETPQR